MSADHNKIIIDDPEEAQWALASHELAKFIGNVLVRAYPKRRWFVHADCRQGIVDIQLADVTMRMGYTLKLGHKTFFNSPRRGEARWRRDPGTLRPEP